MNDPKDKHKSIPPWTDQEVADLNWYQQSGWHEYTCNSDGCRNALVATTDGWVCPACGYKQQWVAKMVLAMGKARTTPEEAIKQRAN